MSDIAIFGWGIMIGSWITSLHFMRKVREPVVRQGEQMLIDMAAKIQDKKRFAPDCLIEVEQPAMIAGHRYLVTISPTTPPSSCVRDRA